MTTLRSSVILATLVAGMNVAFAHADDNNLWMNQAAGPDMLNTGAAVNALPLVSISLGAASQIVNSYSVDVTAVVNTWSVNKRYEPSFASHRVDFAVQPGQKDTVVLKTLEMKQAESPQTMLDKMLIDGALTLNVVW